MATPEPDLSVLVACRGRADALGRLLAGLGAQTLDDARYEVIVVDDGTDPPLAAQLPGPLADNARVLRQAPGGPASARNLALRHARAPLLLFLNADAVPPPELLAQHLAAHSAGGAPRAVMGTFDWLEEQRTPFVRLLEEADVVFPYGAAVAGEPLRFTFFWTGNLSVPAAAVRAVGGFDPAFPYPIWEDVELGYRLTRSGVELFYDPDLRCGHDHPMTPGDYVRRCWWLGSEWVRFVKKHGPGVLPILDNHLAPTRETARELLTAVLALDKGHRTRLARLHAHPGPPDLGGVTVLETMRGLVAGICGLSPATFSAVAALDRIAAVVTLDEARRSERVALADALADRFGGLVDVVALDPRDGLGLDAPGPDDPSPGRARRAALGAATSSWSTLLEASEADVFVFVDERAPSHDELSRLRAALRSTPALGAVALGGDSGPRPLARISGRAFATRRDLLADDLASAPARASTLADRLAARGLLLAEV